MVIVNVVIAARNGCSDIQCNISTANTGNEYQLQFIRIEAVTIPSTIAQLGVQYGHMGYYFITVAFMLVTVMLLSCCVPYYVVLLLDVMFVHVLHLSCLVCMYPNCFVAFPLYILVHGCPCFL